MESSIVGGKRIVVDGSMVIRYGGEPRLANLKLAIEELKRGGYNPLVYVDAIMRWIIKESEKTDLEQMIELGEIKQAPPGTESDYWMLRLLEKNPDWLLLSNDLFRDYAEDFHCVNDPSRFVRFTFEEDKFYYGTFEDLKVRPSISSRLVHEMAAIAKNVSERVASEIVKDFAEKTSEEISKKALKRVSEESTKCLSETYRKYVESKDFQKQVDKIAGEAAKEVVRKCAENYAREAVAKILPELKREAIETAEKAARDVVKQVSESIARKESERVLRTGMDALRKTAQETAEETVKRQIAETTDRVAREAAEKTKSALEKSVEECAGKAAKEAAANAVSKAAEDIVPEIARKTVKETVEEATLKRAEEIVIELKKELGDIRKEWWEKRAEEFRNLRNEIRDRNKYKPRY
jgi:histone H3/H4